MRPTRLFVLCPAFCLLLAGSVCAEIQQIMYAGAISQRTRSGDDVVLRRFELIALFGGEQSFFALLDDPDEGCPWPESFGRGDGGKAHLTYQFDGNRYNILLPELRVDLPENREIGQSWRSGDWRYEVVDPSESDASSLAVRVTGRRGRKRDLSVTAESGILRSARQDVFMGQGERFDLTLEQTTVKTLSTDVAAKVSSLEDNLLSMQTALGRRSDTQQTSLSARQIKEASLRLGELTANAKGTPLEATVQRIARDVERQEKRMVGLGQKRRQMVGAMLPAVSLKSVTSATIDGTSLREKVVVLHFWDYSEKSLSEPYGQVAYLDFIFNKVRQNGAVEVIGVATAPGLSNPATAASASRSVRKLMEFMNISYSVGYDDGTLLKSLGDPRDADGQLPLWVVASPDGKITHYHAGFYEVDRRTGLKALSDAINEAMN